MKIAWLFALGLFLGAAPLPASDLSAQFARPPASARPWVYWFWNNGNVTKAGITADLEAMKRAGIGGVIIMDVVERFAPPPGPADFMNAEWQELFQFAVSEAHRLGLEINMTNGPGWCGSSGPWITPEFSMQMLVATNMTVEGPAHLSKLLPRPETGSRRSHDDFNSTVKYEDYYRDIAILAVPESTNGAVRPNAVVNLTQKLGADGTLNWEVPAGRWTLQRIGHTSTGSSTRPPVKGGNGLECDKLSREAMELHFTNMMGKLIADVGRNAGPTLVATHIDSWEVGSQNWTLKLPEEFAKRRGYDPIPFLPDALGGKLQVGDDAIARRFRWDFQQTISELLATNYVGTLRELAHEHHLRLSLEGYHLPFGDEAAYTAQADEPMSEFWATGASENEGMARQMASVAHTMGDRIVGAEAFTSGDNEQWRYHPATVKALGDYEFSQGINRFVIHRYAHQPYLDRFPGATMGPWGLHYERTQTWWEMSTAWHRYLSRCQFMLRQGLFVADVCYLRPQLPDQTAFAPDPAAPAGYKYDECSAEALIARMNVKDGRLVLPDGMSYRVLVLPEQNTLMTPALVQKIKQLVWDGATVLGPRPTGSPSLTDYPRCDLEVSNLAAEVWGDCDGKTVTEHPFGKGKALWGQPLENVLRQPPDFTSNVKLNWIHRQLGDADIYFVANETPGAVEAQCHFRVNGSRPELWDPQTGAMSALAVYEQTAAGVSIPLRLEASGSIFVVFRPAPKPFDPIIRFTRDDQPVVPLTKPPVIQIQKATYGVPGDVARTRDVRDKVQALVDRGEIEFQVGQLAQGDDPAFGVVKILDLKYTADGQPSSASGRDTDRISLNPNPPARPAEIRCKARGRLEIVASQPGRYELTSASGRAWHAEIKNVPERREITGAWKVSFPPKWGAPPEITLDHLGSLSDSTNLSVKYFSGTATYTKTLDWKPARKQHTETWLDLGDVQVMARVKLNGRDLGVLWKPPYRVNITGAIKSGRNTLEVRVANLWLNRMIGDAALPPAERFTWSSYEPFTPNSELPKSGLIGPVILQSAIATTPLLGADAAHARPITVVSYYFGNYHPGDPRNVKTKGADWSEWELVRNAKPRFPGHQQPHTPLWGWQDESDPAVMANKINAAAGHGIGAFIFDWYYYNDGPFLDRPIDRGFLQASNSARLKFALMWANHDWQEIHPYHRGAGRKTLYPGRVTPAAFSQICDHVIRDYFTRPNYWRVDNKPYFSFYDLGNLLASFGSVEATRGALDAFRAKAVAAGLPGLHLNAVVWGQTILPVERTVADPVKLVHDLGFDSVTSYVWVHHAGLPEQQTEYNFVRDQYFSYWSKAATNFGVPYIPNVTMGWDPSPRADQSQPFDNSGYPFMNIIKDNTPENFRAALELARQRLLAETNGLRVLNLNCWNEWTEGSYLEPDTVHGFDYLDAVKSVFTNAK